MSTVNSRCNESKHSDWKMIKQVTGCWKMYKQVIGCWKTSMWSKAARRNQNKSAKQVIKNIAYRSDPVTWLICFFRREIRTWWHFKWPNCVDVAAGVCLICLFVMTTLLHLTHFGVKAAHQYSWWPHLVIWDWTTLLTSVNSRHTLWELRHLQRCLPGQLGMSNDVHVIVDVRWVALILS